MLQPSPHQEYDPPRRVRDTPVYFISNAYAAKTDQSYTPALADRLPRNIEHVIGSLRKERVLLARASIAGLSVPRPEGLFSITITGDFPYVDSEHPQGRVVVPALVMERFDGVPFRDIENYDERAKALHLFQEEIDKATALGFVPFDHWYWGNSLWNHERQQVHLLDLGMWDWEPNAAYQRAAETTATQRQQVQQAPLVTGLMGQIALYS
jgi:hypothetical protein